MDIITNDVAKESRAQALLVIAGVCFFAGRACLTEGLEPVGAALVSTLLLYRINRLENWQKAIITGAVMIIARSMWFFAGGSVVSVSRILFGGSVAAVSCILFETAAGVLTGKRVNASDELIQMSVSAVVMLMIIGAGLPWLNFPAALVIAVFAGYIGGISEGLTSSFASGMLLFMCEKDPMHIMWLLLFAAAAGVFKCSSRGAAGRR